MGAKVDAMDGAMELKREEDVEEEEEVDSMDMVQEKDLGSNAMLIVIEWLDLNEVRPRSIYIQLEIIHVRDTMVFELHTVYIIDSISKQY